MRTIKFRVWSEEGRKMFNPEYFEHGTSSGIYIPQSDYSTDYLEIMEYTGMEDVNDIEICEGDIVKGHWISKGIKNRFVGEIKYIVTGFKCVGIKQYFGMHIDFNSLFEVIGNIYENKELLDKQT